MRGIHPSKDITGSDGNELADKKVVLCITGSVAAYRAIDMARLLMRHGADVHAVMSQSTSSTLLHADMMEWATGNEVVAKLTSFPEAVAAGKVKLAGNPMKLAELMGLMDEFPRMFEIVEPKRAVVM